MKYLNLYSDQASAVGQIVDTPNVCVIDGMDKTLFIPKSAGNLIGIIKDDDFINYTDPTELQELEGDMLLKFAVDVAKGTTLFVIDDSTEVTANDDYKAGDYLYFSKGTFHPTKVRFIKAIGDAYNYYSEVRFPKSNFSQTITSCSTMFGIWNELPKDKSIAKIIDVSNFDTSKVTTMSTMFGWCQKVKTLDVSNFDTKNVTSMACMFYSCTSLTSLDVSNFDTHNVTLMNNMFYGCSSLTSLDVSSFDTSKLTTMLYMFADCRSLTSLNVSNFDTSKVTDMRYMFSDCPSLTNLIFGSKWGTQTSTVANALTLDLSTIGSSKSYKLTDETYNSMLTMYDRASNGLTTMTIKFSTKHNLPDGFAEKMSALGYTITLV